MRVIAGTAGGMRLCAPHGSATRPTADRVKEALFSILESQGLVQGCRVLDLFAGTGALGIEALSRGAASAVFVESSRQALEALRKNLAHTRFVDSAELVTRDVVRYLEQVCGLKGRFDLILMDPPYQADLYQRCLDLVSAGLLAEGGVLVAELSEKATLPAAAGLLVRTDRRVYGDTALEFYLMERSDAA